MSIELTSLTAMVALLAIVAVLRPAMLFEYPVAASVLIWSFILPQAWRIEASGDLNDFEPTLAWGYMILCISCTAIGYWAGRVRTPTTSHNSLEQLSQRYDLNKLFYGAVALTIVGGSGVFLMYRMAATLKVGEAWTGPIAFYAFVAQLLIYGASLAWLLYLYTGDKKALIVSILGFCVNLPAVLFAARRELTFIIVVVFLLGLFFVKKKSVSRLILVPMVLAGGIFINNAGTIRSFIVNNDASLIGAIAANADQDTAAKEFSEVGSGVSDIAISQWTEQYDLLTPYYNGLINLYIPAFIVGPDFKKQLKVKRDDYEQSKYESFSRGGATHTGFADSFQSLHYFGCLIFLVIAYFMGILWSKARSGDIKSQLYYMMLISVCLKVFTESTSVFFSILPLMFLSMGGVFWYARQRKPSGQHVSTLAEMHRPLRDAHR
ncbi:O-antigen polymerase [Sphingomonas sp.]|uniref:O-antigen polymerase n=1 Tax=Sphingomonas sp. TaxID=28214 RepID=UPI00333FE261